MAQFRKMILLSIAGILLSFVCFSQKTRLDTVEAKLATVENYKDNLDQLYTINAEKLEKHVNETVDKKVEDIDEAKKILKWLLLIGIPATILGLLAVYFGAVKKARKIIVERIETIVEHKREDLIKLIETQEYDTKLKNNKKLLVLSSSDEANEKFKPMFQKLKFKDVNFRSVSTYIEYNSYDLIIFNDSDSSFDQTLIDEYVQNSVDENVSFVVYTNRNLTRHPRINFCNSSFTLYHNILSTLKYTEILKAI